jgi:hypothetical protein
LDGVCEIFFGEKGTDGRGIRINGRTRVVQVEDDSREAPLGKGTRPTTTNAYEVEHTHPRGWSSTPTTRRTAAARGPSRF